MTLKGRNRTTALFVSNAHPSNITASSVSAVAKLGYLESHVHEEDQRRTMHEITMPLVAADSF